MLALLLARAEPALSQQVSPGSAFEADHAAALELLVAGDVEAAIPHLRRAFALDPAHYENGYNLALALLQTGALDEARNVVLALAGRHDTAELLNLVGDIEEAAGNLVAAAQAFERAAHKDATEEHLFDWGNNLLQLRYFDGAVEVFTAAVVRHPSSARLHVGLGVAQYARGQYTEAVASLCRAVDLDPADERPYQFLGEIYGVAPELASEVTNRLAEFVGRHPDNAMAHLYYALSLWKGERTQSEPVDPAQIEALLTRAVTLDPTLARGFLELGILLSDHDRHRDAIAHLIRATELQPGLAQAHYRLAHAYQRTGQTELAEEQLAIFQQLQQQAESQAAAGPGGGS